MSQEQFNLLVGAGLILSLVANAFLYVRHNNMAKLFCIYMLNPDDVTKTARETFEEVYGDPAN